MKKIVVVAILVMIGANAIANSTLTISLREDATIEPVAIRMEIHYPSFLQLQEETFQGGIRFTQDDWRGVYENLNTAAIEKKRGKEAYQDYMLDCTATQNAIVLLRMGKDPIQPGEVFCKMTFSGITELVYLRWARLYYDRQIVAGIMEYKSVDYENPEQIFNLQRQTASIEASGKLATTWGALKK